MIEMSHKTTATIALGARETVSFYDLTALASPVLSQAGAVVAQIDLGLHGDSIEYDTDHGRIELTYRLRDDRVRQIAITCNTLVKGTREIGRQLCFQLTRRLVARLEVDSVFWQPTRQRLLPAEFNWGSLGDAPQRFSAASARGVPTPYPTPLI